MPMENLHCCTEMPANNCQSHHDEMSCNRNILLTVKEPLECFQPHICADYYDSALILLLQSGRTYVLDVHMLVACTEYAGQTAWSKRRHAMMGCGMSTLTTDNLLMQQNQMHQGFNVLV